VNLTSDNTAIVLDSTADFPDAHERFPNWRMVPLYVRFGDESFKDYVELGPSEFYARLRSASELPTTSQPTPGDFLAAFEDLAAYDRILSLHISARLSGTAGSARLAGDELGGDKVRVIDSETASAAIAMLAFAIQRRLEAGTTDEEIDALVERFAREQSLLFTVDTLEFLAKGGRIGGAAKMVGQLLHIKPILTIENGEVVPLKRVRGAAKAFAEFQSQFVASTTRSPTLKVGIAHADAADKAEQLRKMVQGERPEAEVEIVTTLGAVVGTHAGPGTIGFFWFDDRA
jgi:DegV family protein with EDD domain